MGVLISLYFQALELGCLTGHSDRVLSVACGSDANLIASCSLDRSVRLWQPSSAVPTSSGFHRAAVTAVVACKSQQLVVSAARDGSIHFWRSWEGRFQHRGSIQADEKAVSALCMINEKTLVTGAESGGSSTLEY